MRKRIIFLIVTLIISVLCGCGSDVVVQKEAKRAPSTGTSWTVMMYMCGSTLEEDYSRGGEVLRSMAYDLPENINVVIETGGSRSWSVENVDPDYNQDYELQKNGIRLVNQNPSANMGESKTLKSFLEWGIKTYPADRYMAVIWNHGGGPLGGAAFDSANSFDSLTPGELAWVLSGLGTKLDILGFDASLMSNLETASAISLYADYMVASEDVMPMSGWDYSALFELLSTNPDMSVPNVGAAICDGVMNKASEEEQAVVSMALTDLSKETMLSRAFDGMAGIMASAVDDINALRDMQTAMNELEHMGGNSPWEGYSNLIDVGELTNLVSQQVGSPAANIAAAINEMVIYKTMSEYHNTSSGLSVFYPQYRDAAQISMYRDRCTSKNYMEFIEKTCINTDIENRDYLPENSAVWELYNNLAYENAMSAAPDMLGRYVLTATHPEILTRVGVNFYMYSVKEGVYCYLNRDYQTRYDSAAGGYVYEFDGRLPMLNSTPVSMYLVSQNTCFDIYSVPVVYNGKIANLRVSKSKQAADFGEYRIIGLWDGVDKYSGMAEREYKKLNTGDVIIPVYRVYGEDEEHYIEGNKIRVGLGGIKITEKLIGDGDYIVSYTAEDMYGASYECDTNNLVATKGNIKIMDY